MSVQFRNMSLLAARPMKAPYVAAERALRWRANHTSHPCPVRGGWAEARMLVGAIDGDSWPWTCIDLGSPAPYFQVLGTAEQCLLEVGLPTPGRTVYRTGTGSNEWVGMPAGCVWWVGAIRNDETFTTTEAFDVGRRWLLTLSLADGYALRATHPTPHRN